MAQARYVRGWNPRESSHLSYSFLSRDQASRVASNCEQLRELLFVGGDNTGM
jgi:hypothetical protein